MHSRPSFFLTICHRFRKKPKIRDDYAACMKEYIDLDHMQPIPFLADQRSEFSGKSLLSSHHVWSLTKRLSNHRPSFTGRMVGLFSPMEEAPHCNCNSRHRQIVSANLHARWRRWISTIYLATRDKWGNDRLTSTHRFAWNFLCAVLGEQLSSCSRKRPKPNFGQLHYPWATI